MQGVEVKRTKEIVNKDKRIKKTKKKLGTSAIEGCRDQPVKMMTMNPFLVTATIKCKPLSCCQDVCS